MMETDTEEHNPVSGVCTQAQQSIINPPIIEVATYEPSEALCNAVSNLQALISQTKYDEAATMLYKVQLQAIDLRKMMSLQQVPEQYRKITENILTNESIRLRCFEQMLDERNRLSKRLSQNLALPSFGGNPLEWTSFWESFNNAINLNPYMSGRQKITLLRSVLKGKALRVLDGYGFSGENYDQALQDIKNQFGEPELIANAYYYQLETMPHRDDCTLQRGCLETIKIIITNLRALGKDVEQETVKNKMLSKFCVPVLREVFRTLDNDVYTVDDVLNALEKAVRIEERIQRILSYRNKSSQESNEPTTAPVLAATKKSFGRKMYATPAWKNVP